MNDKKVELDCEYFECQNCGAIIKVNQIEKREKYANSEYTIFHPTECYENQGGCGKKSKFLRLKKEYVQNNLKRVEKI
jgi:hypothetical protein